jgi:hypothetical protein
MRRALDNETNEVIPPKYKARTIPALPRILAALRELPRRGLWVISRDDGEAIGYDRAGGYSRQSRRCTRAWAYRTAVLRRRSRRAPAPSSGELVAYSL